MSRPFTSRRDSLLTSLTRSLPALARPSSYRGRDRSFVFWKLPTKKQLPNYYEVIKNPVALDDVKTKVEREQYPTLAEFQQDIENCFRNAKKYNMRDSPIWKDAKVLHVRLATP